jgi:exopolyphosphatase
MSVNSYLIDLKNEIVGNPTFHCVIGNEASDLDSMATSVAYAYFLSRTKKKAGELYLPVINIPRVDFKLRTEAVYLFEKTGINIENLIFIDQISLAALLDRGSLKLILIDHNKLASSQEKFEGAVEEIVDHHKDEGLYTPSEGRTIEPVGSAATLVAEKMINLNTEPPDPAIAELLLGTILLDTVNLDPQAQRVTPKDETVARRLFEITGADQNELFSKLQAEKFNTSALDTPDLLRKDYKEWQLGAVKLGISSVLLPVKEWLNKDPDIVEEFFKYAQSRKLDILLAMNAYTDPEFKRELVVFSADDQLKKKTVSFLLDSKIGLKKIDAGIVKGTEKNIAFFCQGDLSKSRKKLQPLLNEYFNS